MSPSGDSGHGEMIVRLLAEIDCLRTSGEFAGKRPHVREGRGLPKQHLVWSPSPLVWTLYLRFGLFLDRCAGCLRTQEPTAGGG